MKHTSPIVHSDPDIMGGTPVFFGTRVPMKILLDYLEGGDSLDEFLDHFPTVKRDRAIAAIEEAEAIAQQLGLSINELHRKAMKDYWRKDSRIEILEKLNKIYSEESSELDPVLAKMELMSLPHEEW